MCKRLVFDIETDGLLPTMTTLHCIVVRDLDDESQVSEYFGPKISEAIPVLESADELWGHYAVFFDVPALRKFYPEIQLDDHKIFDSSLASRLAYPFLKNEDYARSVRDGMPKHLAGSHSLEAWGWRLGSPKVGLDASFTEFTPDLLARCVQDTALTVDLIRQCHAVGLPSKAWEIECRLAPYLAQQEANGFHFDVEAARSLVAQLRQKQFDLRSQLTEWGSSWPAPSGRPFVPKRDNRSLGYQKGVAVQKYKTVYFNPNSRQHIVKRLKEEYGWNPEVFTDEEGTRPKLDEAVLTPLSKAEQEDGTMRYPIVTKLLEHFEVGKQLGFLADGRQAWLDVAARSTIPGTQDALTVIRGHINQMGTDYVRASHSSPNLGQVPKGAEFRSLFYVPRRIGIAEWSLVGVDMSGIELRMLAHFTSPYDGGEYARIVLEGDPHSANAGAWGVTRDRAKTGIYALIYGAGDKKLGRTLFPHLLTEGDQKSAGRKARAGILSTFVGLGRLTDRVREKAGQQGYLLALDGRRLPIRADYAALNNVLQSAAAVCAKQWIVNVNEQLTKDIGPQGWYRGWAAQMWVHDELQIACTAAPTEVMQTMVWGIEEAGRQFNLNVPITGKGRIGHTWAQTH